MSSISPRAYFEDLFENKCLKKNKHDKYIKSLYLHYKSLDLGDQFEKEKALLGDENAFLIGAVCQDNIELLKNLADNSDCCTFKNPKDSSTLLQIAIISESKEISNYLLSILDFPIDHLNHYNKTAVMYALYYDDNEFADHVTAQLIKKGASTDFVILKNCNTLLHYAVERNLAETVKILIEMGYNVDACNARGHTPLLICLMEDRQMEILMTLLCYKADPTIQEIHGYKAFEYSVVWEQMYTEVLFLHCFDEYIAGIDVHLEVLLLLAEKKSFLFKSVLEFANEVIVGNGTANFGYILLVIDVEYVDMLMKKCDYAIREVFSRLEQQDSVDLLSRPYEMFPLENVTRLLESEFTDSVVAVMSRVFIDNIFKCRCEESVMIEYACYFLSYGFKLKGSILKLLYKKYGYGELLRILLHMDIVQFEYVRGSEDVFLLFIFNVRMNLKKYLKNPYYYSTKNVQTLLHYFSHPDLRKLCKHDRNIRHPDVPLLVELARNAFRNHFIETFNINTAKQFYGLLNGLPISATHKKIITYETKLY